ncbi:MAG: hypothetical protein ACOYMA_04350 [Bacteroidia bacterium]
MEHVVGYMLKVIKSGRRITNYKDEFNSIKHGDYAEFLKLVDGSIPMMIKWNNGIITDESNNPKYDCDFEGLYKSGPSLKLFYSNCLKLYGEVYDTDIPDEIYHKIVVFEIAIRMHANNHYLLIKTERTNLKFVIDLLGEHLSLSTEEINLIHEGRKFLNKVKHQVNRNYSWEVGYLKFEEAFKLLKEKELLIFL